MIARAATFSPYRTAAYFVPPLSVLAAIFMMPLPMGLQVFGLNFMPNFPLISIFLWTLYRAELLSPLVVLLLGIASDLLMRGPLGASCLVFLTGYGVTISQRVYWTTLKGTGLIGGFLFVVFAAEFIAWGANSFAHGAVLNPMPAIAEGIASALILPVARAMFAPLARLAGAGGI